jgi:AcrR family transcriptional regulator
MLSGPVKPPKRSYRSPAREERAAATRAAVLKAARELFMAKGYAAVSVAEIAKAARVNLDTVYVAVGRKPQLLRALIEAALSGRDEAVPAHDRDYVAQIRACPDAAGKLGIYARAVTAIQDRLAPIFLSLSQAAVSDPDCAALWVEIGERRARNMRDFIADVRAAGGMREDLTDDEAADIVWSMNGTEYYVLLVHRRGWTNARFAAWLEDAWRRTLLVTT